MLSLPRVTLVCIDCANHDLALAALEQCTRKCTFERVLFITDRDFAIPGIDSPRAGICPTPARGGLSPC